jgi:hypothetical protein
MVDPKPVSEKVSYPERFKALLAEWGPLFLWVWFGLFAIVLVSFAFAIKLGFGVEGTAGTAGIWGAAWVATQFTKPLRFAATLVITPALAALIRRMRKQPAPVSSPAAVEPEPTPADSAGFEPTEPPKH